MTWHLKDRELEKKLVAIDPEFINELTEAVDINLKETKGRFNHESTVDVELSIDDETAGTFRFFIDTLEEIPEYNPNDWNEYPKVTPPYKLMMRIDYGPSNSRGYKAFYKHFEKEDSWCLADGTPLAKMYSDAIARFRPWED